MSLLHTTKDLPRTLHHTIQTHRGPVNALAFSALGGTYILSGSSDREIHLCRSLPTNSTGSSKVQRGSSITSTTATNTETITTPTTSRPIQRYTSHGYAVLDLAVSADNASFASCGGDRSVFLWDTSAAQTIRRFGSNTDAGHTARVNCVRFAGEGDAVVVSGGDDRRVLAWDCRSRDARPVAEMAEARDGVAGLWCPTGVPVVVSGSVDGRVRWYDLRMGVVKTDVMPAGVVSVEGTRDGNVCIVGVLDDSVRMMDGKDGKCLRCFVGGGEVDESGGGVGYTNSDVRLKNCLARDESLVLAGSEGDGYVRAWDVNTARMVGHVEVSDVPGKVISVVKWREKAKGQPGVWAAGGVEGSVKIYGETDGLT